MIKAIVIELEYYDPDYRDDGYVVDKVHSTEPVQCTVVYPDGVACNQSVEVRERSVLSKMAPVPLATLSHEEALGMVLTSFDPVVADVRPTTIAGVLKNMARLRLKRDLGENPDEWGLKVETEISNYVCYGRYSGEVYKDDK